ncbi:MAG: hypothetical protein LUG51_12405 [Tannerellaceae bacterium]|nr:hypothetical protein [Tannerellaceae bacterium]
MKNVIICFLLTGLIVGLPGCKQTGSQQVKSEEIGPSPSFVEQSADHQMEANQYFARLMDTFRKEAGGKENVYPEWYAGSYITPEGKLSVQVQGDTVSARAQINKAVGSDHVILESVTFSRTTLQALSDQISHFLTWNPQHPLSKIIPGWSIDEYSNTLHVNFIKDDPELMKVFRQEISNSPAIRLVVSGRVEKIANGGGQVTCHDCGVTVRTIKPLYHPADGAVDIEVINNTQETMEMWDEFIEYYNGTGWDRILIEGFLQLQVLKTVPPNSSHVFNVSLHPVLYEYEPGRYRIWKTVKGSSSGASYNIAAEFELEANPPVTLSSTPAAYNYPATTITVTITNGLTEELQVMPGFRIESSDFFSWQLIEEGNLSQPLRVAAGKEEQIVIPLSQSQPYASGYSNGVFRIKMKTVTNSGQEYELISSFWLRYEYQ